MFHIYFTNFQYAVDGFKSIQDALAYVQQKGFMAGIYDESYDLHLSWNPISGTTYQRD